MTNTPSRASIRWRMSSSGFALHYESGYQRIAIDPALEPNVSPYIQQFPRLLEIAESEAK
jgi:hypothetical protein